VEDVFSRTLLVQVAASTPQTTGRLLAVWPNMAQLLAVMALCKIILRFIGPTLTAVWQRLGSLKISCDFAVLGKVIRNKERF
jgi:hypothetical protein